jgi:hypothetical protein
MMAPKSLKDDGGWKRGRIERSERGASVGSLQLPKMFLRRDWGRGKKKIFSGHFGETIDLEVKENRVIDRRDRGSLDRRIGNEGIMDEH